MHKDLGLSQASQWHNLAQWSYGAIEGGRQEGVLKMNYAYFLSLPSFNTGGR